MSDELPPDDFTGLWISRGCDGSRREWEMVEGVRTGLWRVILANGVVQRECLIQDGLYHGEMVVRNDRGEVLDVSPFDRGSGIYRIFMSSGKLGWEIEVRGGKKHGLAKRFTIGGELSLIEVFEDGRRIGVFELDSSEARKRIQEGVRQLEAGSGIPHAEVVQRLARWKGPS